MSLTPCLIGFEFYTAEKVIRITLQCSPSPHPLSFERTDFLGGAPDLVNTKLISAHHGSAFTGTVCCLRESSGVKG
jgi:hypothetical protein